MANQGGTHEQHVKAGQQSHKKGDEKLHGAAAKSHEDKQAGERGASKDQSAKSGHKSSKSGH